mgnify:CR=1 FL=1
MHFDDRLDTVLRLPDSGDGMARIQFRQLVDILGRLPASARSSVLEAGFDRLAALSALIPASDRARLLRRPLQPITNARMVASLAEAEPDVASAGIAAARLDEAEWLALIPALPVRARGILRHRRDLPGQAERLLEQLGGHAREDSRPSVASCRARPSAWGSGWGCTTGACPPPALSRRPSSRACPTLPSCRMAGPSRRR